MLIFEMIVGFITAIIIYNVIHHFFITRPIDIGNKETINVLDDFIYHLNDNLDNTLNIVERNNNSVVWGRNIYDYEYILKYTHNHFNEDHLRININSLIKTFNNSKKFNHDVIVTDFFIRDGLIHIDLAYLLNSATYEYVLDMKKLDK
ncbi:hypothetical protein [Apilactobacillus timberlakei]|uniref:hypothetical protein n=1 Tax=Apilactobacillus timberlakei TaxID=2008380 RepID=UPI00112E1892|nr:hypothetical protein [Apilactobacillus timberlakei]TPR17393.1 hypothetical protein DYZ95_05250 [Apilactobacillus timberlakei]